MNKQRFYDLLKLIVFVLFFAGLPLGMVIFGYNHTKAVDLENNLKKLASNISVFYTKLTPFADQQRFWIYLFNSQVAETVRYGKTVPESMNNVAEKLKQLNKSYDFDYLVYHPNYPMIASLSADTLGGTERERKLALNYCWGFQRRSIRRLRNTPEIEEARGKVFGPQFYPGHMGFCEPDFPYPTLCWTDSMYQRRPFWASGVNDCLTLAFIKPESLTDTKCLLPYLENAHNEIGYNTNFAVIEENNRNNNRYSDLTESEIKEIDEAYKDYGVNRSFKIETSSFVVFPKYLRPGITVMGYVKKSDISGGRSYVFWISIFMITILFAVSVIVYGWKIIINKNLDRLSIKWKLGFLFFFANGLPLIVLAYIGNDFVSQTKENYIQDLMKEGTAFLQDFDEKYELELARCLIRKEKLKKSIFNEKRNTIMSMKELDSFFTGVSSDTIFCYFISSGSQTLIRNTDGFFDQRDLKRKTIDELSPAEIRKEKNVLDRSTKRQIQFAEKFGHFFLNQVNNTAVDEKEAAEIEMLVEATLRRKLNNFIFDVLLSRGTFMKLGSSHKLHLSLMDTASFGGHNVFDYYIVVVLRKDIFQNNYLERVILRANRNELGLKVIAFTNVNEFIPQSESSVELMELNKRLSTYPTKDAILIKHKGCDYIAMGFECKHLSGNKIIGLYPLDIIEEHVKIRRNEIIMISLLSFLMTLALSWAIIKAFITPLSEITRGAKAIEQKNFEYRLPELGRDEFGAMGKIFNGVMVDFDELSVAGTIQEQLLPGAPIKTGRFSLFGKSVAMGALGGDYFDFIELEDNKFCVALGDVAGHGVGSALIMAMAKAALIQLDSLWTQPQQIISRLHEMIYMSKTQKQRKIMTFQYMYIDGNNGEALYSNAGGCSPFIVRKSTNTVEELKLPGAVLGAFKKGKFSEINVKFEPGDAIVFYTDGIVESKDKNGEMLGYDNLKKLFLRCWDADSETFYKNIYQEYINYIGSEDNAGDDLTMVVMVFNEAPAEEASTDETPADGAPSEVVPENGAIING